MPYADRSTQRGRRRILTVPSAVTAARLAMGAAAIGLSHKSDKRNQKRAAWLWGVACALDGVDGYLARRLGQETDFGALFDLRADNVFEWGMLHALAKQGRAPRSVLNTVLARDAVAEVARIVGDRRGADVSESTGLWDLKATSALVMLGTAGRLAADAYGNEGRVTKIVRGASDLAIRANLAHSPVATIRYVRDVRNAMTATRPSHRSAENRSGRGPGT